MKATESGYVLGLVQDTKIVPALKIFPLRSPTERRWGTVGKPEEGRTKCYFYSS